jgi:hypothetical protein
MTATKRERHRSNRNVVTSELRTSERHPPYQIETRSASARSIGDPGGQSKACANPSTLASVPITR